MTLATIIFVAANILRRLLPTTNPAAGFFARRNYFDNSANKSAI